MSPPEPLKFDPPLKLDIDPEILKDALAGLAGLPFEEISTAIDIGAHAGSVSIALAHKGVRVLAVEPLQIARLAANIEMNQFQRRITILQAAVGTEERRDVALRRAGNDAMCGTTFLTCRSLDEGNALSVTPAQLYNMTGPVDFVKVDIEGAEWAILACGGFKPLFRNALYVDLELHPAGEFFPEGIERNVDVYALMTEYGFEPYTATNKQQLWKNLAPEWQQNSPEEPDESLTDKSPVTKAPTTAESPGS
jgi:FkbM family methyltransferase